MTKFRLEADGVKIDLWRETDGDIRLKLDDLEPVILSFDTAFLLGIALQNMDESDYSEAEKTRN